MPPVDIDRIAARFEPAMRKALLGAWETLRGKLSAGVIADAMQQGADAVIRLLSSVSLTDAERLKAVQPLVGAAQRAAYASAKPFVMLFNLPDPIAAGWVLSTADQMGWLRVGVDDDWRQFIRQTVRRAFVEGGHPYETARLIRGSLGLNGRQAEALARFGEGLTRSGIGGSAWDRAVARQRDRYVKQRAVMIARTETIRAAQQGQLAVWDQAVADGILEPERTWRVWIAAANACDICLGLNGTEVRLNDEWPGYGMVASAHPQCKCSQGLKFHDDDIVRHPPTAKAWVVKPLGDYADWDACVRTMTGKLGSRQAAERYCGRLESLING